MNKSTGKFVLSLTPSAFSYIIGLGISWAQEDSVEAEYTFKVSDQTDYTNIHNVSYHDAQLFSDKNLLYLVQDYPFGEDLNSLARLSEGEIKGCSKFAWTLYAFASIYGESIIELFPTKDKLFTEDNWKLAQAWLGKIKHYFNYNMSNGVLLNNHITLYHGNMNVMYQAEMKRNSQIAFLERTQNNVFIHTSNKEFAEELNYNFLENDFIFTTRVTDSDLEKYEKILNSLLT